jgi:chemotaxis protein methyltransferase CheR
MDDIEYNYIKRQVLILTQVDLNSYKAPQMQRRLKAYLHRSGHASWPKFFRVVQTDPVELNKFRDYLTINVSSFFRDPEKYRYLEKNILPELLRRRNALRIWSAGCSRGQEVYSLAILLAEAGGLNYRHHLLATDIDHSALDFAKAGGPYTADDIAQVPAGWRLRYLEMRQNSYWAKDELRRQVKFQEHNLLDGPPADKFDLIVCRNVVIYFQPEAKDKLYHRFYEALKPGGILFVGSAEIVSHAVEIGFEMVSISFYRRRAEHEALLRGKPAP